MNTCWQILQIEPTTDLDAIKDARRALIKNWHPDIVPDADRKREYTARCAEINVAFDRASGFAKAWKPAVAADSAHAERRRRRHRSGGPLTESAVRVSYIVMIVFSFIWLSSMSRAMRHVMGFVIPFAFCLGTTHFVDSLLLAYALRPLLAGIADPKVNRLAAGILLSAFNIFMLAAGLSSIGGQAFGTIGGAVFNLAVGLVIPISVSMKSDLQPSQTVSE